MKIVFLFLAASVALTVANAAEIGSLYGFLQIIRCLVDTSFSESMQYNGYGCYCGYGGSGSALDNTDKCCLEHDNCYGMATSAEVGCSSFNTYTISYDFVESVDDQGNCAIECKAEKDYPADENDAKCKAFMCECDRKGSQCFANERHTFSSSLVNYAKASC